MAAYRYTLEKGSRKHRCPVCGRNSFVRYIDTETGNYLPEQYGRCDHEQSCGHHLNPYNDGYNRQTGSGTARAWIPRRLQAPPAPKPTAAPVVIPDEVYKPFEAAGLCSGFVRNLRQNVPFPFPDTDISKVVQLYRLGAVPGGYMAGAVCFPFIDTNGNIRAVQVKQFDETNHTTRTTFLHAMLRGCGGDWVRDYEKQEKRITCLFGTHLLKQYPHNPVYLVEAPKTAIVGTLYYGFPDESSNNPVWLAVYNKSSFTYDKLKALEGRRVEVFSDLSRLAEGDTHGATFQEWERKAEALQREHPRLDFRFNGYLEQVATDEQRAAGLDLADFLTNEDWRQMRRPTEGGKPPVEAERDTDGTNAQSRTESADFATNDGQTTAFPKPQMTEAAAVLVAFGFPADWQPIKGDLFTGCDSFITFADVERETQLLPY